MQIKNQILIKGKIVKKNNSTFVIILLLIFVCNFLSGCKSFDAVCFNSDGDRYYEKGKCILN